MPGIVHRRVNTSPNSPVVNDEAADSHCDSAGLYVPQWVVDAAGRPSGLYGPDGAIVVPLPGSKFKSSTALVDTTAVAGDVTGADNVVLVLTANAANAYTLRTAAQMYADTPGAYIGKSWSVRIASAGDNTVTVTTATGVTLTGTMTIATTTYRDFIFTFVSATAVTVQNVGSGTT